MRRVIGESSAPSTVARTRSPCARDTESSAPTTSLQGGSGSSLRPIGLSLPSYCRRSTDELRAVRRGRYVDQNLPDAGGISLACLRSLLRGERHHPCDRAGRQGGDGSLRFMLALRQSSRLRGGPPWRTQERLLGDLR